MFRTFIHLPAFDRAWNDAGEAWRMSCFLCQFSHYDVTLLVYLIKKNESADISKKELRQIAILLNAFEIKLKQKR